MLKLSHGVEVKAEHLAVNAKSPREIMSVSLQAVGLFVIPKSALGT